MSGKQISLFKSLPEQELQSYITQIQTIKASSRGLFQPTPVNQYAEAIQGLEAKQAALLLSTQGLTNAQIAETLAVNESNIAKNYQAMVDAGLLKSKQTLTVAQIQENLQTVLGAEADTSAALSAMGLSAATEAQRNKTVKLTAAKLEEAVATNVLTEAQAQELAMRTGVTLSIHSQSSSVLPGWIAKIKAGTKAILGQVKATAKWLATTPAGWATAAIAAIGGVIAVINQLEKAEKKESDAASELYEKSKEKVQSNKEETNSLKDLIKRYEELKSSSDMDSETRDQIKEIQYDIVDLVGSEAKGLDLVNGKLEEQLARLKEIQTEKEKQNVEDARDAYDNAKYAADVMVGDADDYGNDVSVKWTGTEAAQIHKAKGFEHINYNEFLGFISGGGFDDIVRRNNDFNLFNMRFVVDTTGIDNIEDKIKRLEELKDYLAQNGLRSTGFYQGVVEAIDRYEEQQNSEVEAGIDLMDSVIEDLAVSNGGLENVTVDSVESFEKYRQKMINEAKSDESIGTMLADGLFSVVDVENSINDFMATSEEFSDWYELWIEKTNGTAEENLTFKDKFQNLWDSDSFSDAKKDLAKLAKEAGITEKDIQSLASENSELASLLNESGMSAQFAATCFNKMSNGADGFSSITEDALALDKVLHGMDESLQNVAASKSTYDKALEQDDYDTEFENYQEAYKNAMQMFEDGDYGRHFRSSMEYFLGEDSYTMSIEELYSAMNNLKSVFGENATNGLEFVDKLYAKQDILDGMDSSLRKLSDGSYDFDLKPDEFEKIGEALGMTAEEVAACTNALGMFGNFHSYDLEEVEKTLNGISIAAKNGEQSILSMQGVEKILADIGYNGYEIYHIMQDIKGMDSIQMLDFGVEDAESIQAVIDKLKELDMIEISGNGINVSGLIDSLHESLGMAADDINTFLENINGQFKFADAEGSLISLDQAKNMALQAEDASAADGIDKIGESADNADGKVNALHTDMEALNTLSLGGLMTQFNSAGTAVDNLNSKVQNLAAQMDAVNNKSVSASGVSTGAVPATNASAAKPNAGKVKALGNAQIGHSFSSGTIGAPKTETALINELGNETIIDPEKGTYEVVGGGAQFRKIKKGQIILNHLQTKALQKFGKISSFGKMLFGGNADIKGSSYAGGTAGGINPATKKPYQQSSNNNESKKATEEAVKETAEQAKEVSEEVFDWIEKRIEYFKRKFDKWIKQAESAVTSGFITKYYKKATNAIKKELSTYGKAYNRYMKEANAVGLDKKYRDKVKNGTIDIETIQDEALADKIQKYQEWYNKATESTESFMETAEELYNLPLDKAATKIEKFKDAIDLLDKKLDNAIGSKAKNKLVDKQTKQEKKTIDANRKAEKESQKNLKAAGKNLTKSSTFNSSDVSANEKKKIKQAVKNGKEVNLSYFKEGSKAYNAAVKYNEALKANKQATYELATAQEEYNAWLVEASKIKFDNIADDYNKRVQMLGFQMDALDNRISEIETKGEKVHKAYYESQKAINDQELAQYKAEKAALEESLKNIKQGTDEWYDALEEINNVSSAISDCVKETYNLNNAINQLHFDLFNDISESIGRIITEQEFLQGLFAHEKNADDETGNLTEAGIAKLGSLSAGYYASKSRAEKDKAEVQELQRMFDSKSLHSDLLGITFNSIDDLEEKLKETYDKWQGDIKETYSLESNISDLMKEKYQAELDMLQDLIDAKKDALKAEKDLHDYQRDIQKKTKDINTIQMQIAAYSGDTSQEAMAKLQKLQAELNEKKDGLKETEYDKYISDQEDMLDKLYGEYNEAIQKKMDDFMGLVQEGLDTANKNTALISDYLCSIAGENGYLNQFKNLFNGAGGIKDGVDKNVSDITADETKGSGTSPTMPAGLQRADISTPASNTPVQSRTEANTGNDAHTLELNNASHRDNAKEYISKHANRAKKKKGEYSDVNQKIYDNKAKSYNGTGKVLSSDEMKGLSKKLGVEYDGASKSGKLYQKLKSIKFPGFKKGGVVPVDDIEKQVHNNGDTSLVSVQSGEAVLTPVQTDLFQKFTEKMPEMVQAFDMSNLVKVPNYVQELQALHPVQRDTGTKATFGDVHYTFELPNVIDENSFVKTIQSSEKVRRCIKSFTVDRLAGAGRLAYKNIR